MRPKLESLIPPTFFFCCCFWKWQGELMDEAVTFQSSKNLERINDSVPSLSLDILPMFLFKGGGLEIRSSLQVPVGFRFAFFVICPLRA